MEDILDSLEANHKALKRHITVYSVAAAEITGLREKVKRATESLGETRRRLVRWGKSTEEIDGTLAALAEDGGGVMDNCKQHTGAFCLSCEITTLRAQVARLEGERDEARELKVPASTETVLQSTMSAAVANTRAEAAEAKCERQETGLRELDDWSKAYPLEVFPEPDFKKAAELLKAGGQTLDAISASNMRHVVKRVGEIARAAMDDDGGGDE